MMTHTPNGSGQQETPITPQNGAAESTRGSKGSFIPSSAELCWTTRETDRKILHISIRATHKRSPERKNTGQGDRRRGREGEREREGRRSLSARFYLRLKRGEKERGWGSREEYLCMMMIMTEKSLSKE